jgi:hypothetical protein
MQKRADLAMPEAMQTRVNIPQVSNMPVCLYACMPDPTKKSPTTLSSSFFPLACALLYILLYTMAFNQSFSSDPAPPSAATGAVLVESGPVPEGAHEVHGVDFDRFQGRDITVAEMVDSMAYTGFQGSAVSEASRVLNQMVFHLRSALCLLNLTVSSSAARISPPRDG